MKEALKKASVLVEALPYIQKFHGKTVVVKYGGSAMINDELKHAVMMDVILMRLVGMNPVLVHGGGPDINKMLERLEIESSFVNGLRVTDRPTMEVVEMVLVGKVNKGIVSQINALGGKAVGLSGKDGNMIKATASHTKIKGEDGQETLKKLGLVGDIKNIDTDLIYTMTDKGYIPVIAPIGVDEKGQSYNINADHVAGELAVALNAEKLVLLTDVEGIYRDYEDKTSLITRLNADEVEPLIQSGVISGGMIPKVKCCLDAVRQGVNRSHILDGRLLHSILLEIFTNEGIGTMIKND